MIKQKILVDMDGVLADVYKPLIFKQYTQRGIAKTEEELNGVEEREAFTDLASIVNNTHFFADVPIMNGSYEGLLYLNEKFDVRIVSSAMEFDNCLDDKFNWMKRNFPFIGWRQIVLCGVKEGITGDIMLDDHPKNLDNFNGKRFIFTQPHNITLSNPTYTRINNWDQVTDFL